MSYQPKPTTNGTYRIRVLNQNLCIECESGGNGGIKLTPPSSSNNLQKWNLIQVPGQTDVWTITSANDQSGLTYRKTAETYWGYGYPLPQNGPSQNWKIVWPASGEHTSSRIKLANGSDCFDACDPGSDWVHFYYEQRNVSNGPRQCYVFELIPPDPPAKHALDIVFLQDFTGSQQPYIDSARNEVGQICSTLLNSGNFAPNDLRFGVIAFRDHPPQDNTLIAKTIVDLTTNLNAVTTGLSSLSATGGGDGPEAQTDSMAEALDNVSWNRDPKASKVAVLITDAPPHGIKEPGDYWPDRCPCQRDPLRLAARMLRVGITLYVIACEPTLSQSYQGGRHFYEGLVKKTHGKVYNLGDPNSLTQVIIGCALQEADSNRLVAEHQAKILGEAQNRSFNAVSFAQKLHSDLSAANVHHHTLTVDSMVEPNQEGDKIVQIWFEAENLDEANAKITKAAPCHLKHQYSSGGSPAAVLEKKPINLSQVETVVQKCLARQS
ncbi:hypothetical protein FRC09_003417 [Ceratobasidium sp. 395]|nr:hypothetical protein FRC09_003417 [Ceratobasidium sp. 395]